MRIKTWLRATAVALGSTALLAGVPGARADQMSDLLDKVERQGALIEDLQGEVADLKSDKGETADQGGGNEKETESAPEVTSEYVDQRIEDFETAPASRFMISGYGTAQFVSQKNEVDGFGVRFNPGFHFRMSDRLHFNGELELELGADEGGTQTDTDTNLEFSQIDFLLNDWMVLSGGYFLTPFNYFGQRLHPSWINKMASRPILYGHRGIIPVIKQVGLMVGGGAPLWSDDSKFSYALYVVNAPTVEDPSNPGDPVDRLHLNFTGTPPVTSDVAYGGRFGFLPIPNLEIGVSFQTGELARSSQRFNLIGSDVSYRWRELEIRGEYVRLSQGSTNPAANGYYIQAAYRLRELFPTSESLWSLLGRVEPVLRWGQLAGYDRRNREQLAMGLVYWLYESAPLKFTYERNTGAIREDKFIAQFSYGF